MLSCIWPVDSLVEFTCCAVAVAVRDVDRRLICLQNISARAGEMCGGTRTHCQHLSTLCMLPASVLLLLSISDNISVVL